MRKLLTWSSPQWLTIFTIVVGLVLTLVIGLLVKNHIFSPSRPTTTVNVSENNILELLQNETVHHHLYKTPFHLLSYEQKAEAALKDNNLPLARRAIRYAFLTMTNKTNIVQYTRTMDIYKVICIKQHVIQTSLALDAISVLVRNNSYNIKTIHTVNTMAKYRTGII